MILLLIKILSIKTDFSQIEKSNEYELEILIRFCTLANISTNIIQVTHGIYNCNLNYICISFDAIGMLLIFLPPTKMCPLI